MYRADILHVIWGPIGMVSRIRLFIISSGRRGGKLEGLNISKFLFLGHIEKISVLFNSF